MALPDDDKRAKLRELLALRDRLKLDRDNFRLVNEATQRGLVDAGELEAFGFLMERNALGQVQVGPFAHPDVAAAANPASDAAQARSTTLSKLATNVKGRVDLYYATKRRAGLGLFLETAGKQALAGILGQVPSVTELVGMGSGPSGMPFAQLAADKMRDGIASLLGQEQDPLMRAAQVQGGGGSVAWGEMTGDLAAFMASMLVGPKGVGTGARFLQPGLAARAPGGLGRYLYTKNAAGLTWAGGGVAALAGLGGYGVIGEDDGTLATRMQMAMSNAGLVVGLGTVLMARPATIEARALRDLDRDLSKVPTKSALAAARKRVGLALNYQPHLTVGRLAHSGGSGAFLTYSLARQQGMSEDEALLESSKAGLEFIGWDVAFAGIGSARRWLDIQAKAAGKAGRAFALMGVVPAGAGTAAATTVALSDGGDPNLAAAFGAGGAAGLLLGASAMRRPGKLKTRLSNITAKELELSAQDTRMLAEMSSGAHDIQLRLRSVLPDDVVVKLATKDYAGLPPEVFARAAALITNDSWRAAISENYAAAFAKGDAQGAAFAEQLRTASGGMPASLEAAATSTRLAMLTQEIAQRELAGATLAEPELARAMGAYATINEPLVQGILERAAPRNVIPALEQQARLYRIPHEPPVRPTQRPLEDFLAQYPAMARATKIPPLRVRERADFDAHEYLKVDHAKKNLDAVLADKDATVDRVRTSIEALKGTVKQEGDSWVIDLPDLVRASSRNLREALAQARGNLAGIMGATALGGYYATHNDEDGTIFGWAGDDDALKAMATLGIVLPRGRALRLGTLTRLMQRVGRVGKAANRELMFYLGNSGRASVLIGTERAIKRPLALEEFQAGITFSFHNHPRLSNPLLNALPSPADLTTFAATGEIGVVGSVSGALTVVEFASRFPVERVKELTASFRSIYSEQVTRILAEETSERVGVGAAAEIFAQRVRAATDNFLDIRPFVHPAQLETELAYASARRGLDMYRSVEEAFARGPSVESNIIDRIVSPDWKRVLREVYADEFAHPPRETAPPTLRGRPAPRLGSNVTKGPLPASLTVAAFARPAITVSETQHWANQHGMRLVTRTETEASRRYILEDAASQAEIAAAPSLPSLFRELKGVVNDRARAAEQGATRGDIALGLATTGIAGSILSIAGASLEDYLREGEDPTGIGQIAGWTLGAVAGGFAVHAAARGAARGRLSRVARALDVTKAQVDVPLSHEASTAHAGFKQPKLEHNTWLRFTEAAQVEHLEARLQATASLDAKGGARRNTLLATLNKYTLNAPSLNALTKIEAPIRAAADAAGLSAVEAENLWRGYLRQIGTHPDLRARAAFNNLVNLRTTSGGSILSDVTTRELRDVIAAQSASAGPAIPTVPNFAEIRKRIERRLDISPENKLLAMSSEVASRRAQLHNVVGPLPSLADDFAMADLRSFGLGTMRPTLEALRTFSETLVARGNAWGSVIHTWAGALLDSSRNIHAHYAEDMREVNRILHGLTTHERNVELWRVLAGDGRLGASHYRDLHKGNTRLMQAAAEMRTKLDAAADDLKIPAQERLPDYLGWYYSQRTLDDLRRTGILTDEALTLPGHIFPRDKFFRSMEARGDAPLGEYITNIDEFTQLYFYGARRKQYMDQLLSVIAPERLKELATVHPETAARIGRVVLDLHGVPHNSEVVATAFLRGLGVDVEHIAASMGVDDSLLVQPIVRAIQNNADPRTIIHYIRGMQYYTKMWGSIPTAMVNASQIINTATDFGALRAFAHLATTTATGTAVRVLPMLNFIPGAEKAAATLEIARTRGILSAQHLELLDRVGSHPHIHGRDNLVKQSLRLVATLGSLPMGTVEYVLRSTTAGAARSATESSLASRPLRERAGEILDFGVATGLGTGLSKTQLEHERGASYPEALVSALPSFAAGALLGGAFGALAKTTQSRLREERALFDKHYNLDPKFMRGQYHKLAPTDDDAARWIAGQMQSGVEQTQFMMRREHRSEVMRTPVGETLGILQTFIVNNFEFGGKRLHRTMSDLADAFAGRKGVGELDLRSVKHLSLWLGAGSLLSAVVGEANPYSERGLLYWLSRVGLAWAPFLRYNEAADKWQFNNPLDMFARGGPVGSDLAAAGSTFLRLQMDPEARRSFAVQLDELAQQVVVVMRQVESAPEVLGGGMEKLGLEGLADWTRTQGQDIAGALARPFSTAASIPGALAGTEDFGPTVPLKQGGATDEATPRRRTRREPQRRER